MPKAAEFGPQIRQLLEETDDAVTVAALAKAARCSQQNVYKVLQQLGTRAVVVGQSATGAYLYRYDPGGQEAPRGFQRRTAQMPGEGPARKRGAARKGAKRAVFHINDLVTIKGIWAEGDGVVLEFEDEDGQRMKALVVENGGK